jgi:non-specific serine/threonine protein kinase
MDHVTLKPAQSRGGAASSASAGAGSQGGLGSALPAGTRLREFELTGVIGEGGFSIVYAALDQRLGREVAIKEYIPASLARREDGYSVRVRSEQHEESFSAGLAGFMNEARLLAQFKHPALVEVLQFWEDNGTAYMVMPRYHGRTLRQVLRDLGARCDERWLKHTLAPVLDVLELLHERSVFHRDVAPDNILIQRDGRAVLLDLGSAREILGDREQAVTVVVKPGYAPLEQYSGEFSLPQGPWTDVYAFGAVLHFAVTGAPPQASISRVMKDSRALLADSARPGFSERFLRGIDAALALQPADRPQSAAALRALLAFDDAHGNPPDRSSAERVLDALHVDEAITAIVSAEEMADIAARLAGTGVPRAADPATPSAGRAPQAAPPPDPMAAPAPAPEPPVFKDVEDLVSGRLLADTADVRVVSESRLEARIDTEAATEAISRRRTPLIAAGATVAMLTVAVASWLLAGTDSGTATPPLAAPVAIEKPRGATSTIARASAPTQIQPSADAPEAGAAAEPGAVAGEELPRSTAAAAPSGSIRPEARNPPSAAELGGRLAPLPSAPPLAPQPGAAIPEDLWAGDSSIAVDSGQGLPLVDLRDAQSQPPAAGAAADAATGAQPAASTARPAAPRRAASAADSVGVRLGISPWAEVWIGGQKEGVSPPLRELRLAPGRHRIELRNPAFPPHSLEIEVRAGENPAIEHRFSASGA